jgi:hypothetical protein
MLVIGMFDTIHLLTLFLAQAWILFPSRHPTCVLGRHYIDTSKFVAALYSMGKGGVKCLDLGPESAQTRKEALIQLLAAVETEIGIMMLADKKEKRRRDDERERGSGSSGSRN